ncbi:MAG TPA: TIM barrel protein [Halioglobus sp.]
MTMELECYKTLWGHIGSFSQACQQALAAGFSGVEGPAPASRVEQASWRKQLANAGLFYIAEICTAGSYIPDRQASVTQHLSSLERKLEHSVALAPRFVTCIGGCDAWEVEQSLEFFSQSMQLAQNYGVGISFETHRGRSFFNPWVTARICEQLPGLQLTADFSHWCVVCERLMDSEQDVLGYLIDRVWHIHARVGYEQGPQVVDPRLARYQRALQSHQHWWRRIWACQQHKGYTRSTLTPEFGPDGYQQLDAFTNCPVGNLWEINRWMALTQRQQFEQWIAAEKRSEYAP